MPGLKPIHKKTMAQLIEENHYFNEIIAHIPGHIYWMNRQHEFLGCNNNVLKLLKLKNKEEYIGKSYEDFYDQSTCERLRKADEQVMAERKTIAIEEEGIHDDLGHPIYITYKTPLLDENGKTIGLLGTSVDITDRKRAEKAEAKAEGMKFLAAIIAHEMRTPLAAIQLGSLTLKDFLPLLIQSYQHAVECGLNVPHISKNILSGLQESLEAMQNETHAANSFISLMLANIHLKKNISKASFSIIGCVKQALSDYPFHSKKQKDLVKLSEVNDFTIIADKDLITHILNNLLKNALWHIDSDTDEIQIRFELGDNYNKLIFKDTGPGIPKKTLEHIFDRFYTEKEMGAGIGLPFCQWAMEQLGGSIECHSKTGRFTEFILKFPVSKKITNKL